MANADFIGGFGLWIDSNGKLNHTYSFLGVDTYKQTSTEKIPAGEVTVKMLFEPSATEPPAEGRRKPPAEGRRNGALTQTRRFAGHRQQGQRLLAVLRLRAALRTCCGRDARLRHQLAGQLLERAERT